MVSPFSPVRDSKTPGTRVPPWQLALEGLALLSVCVLALYLRVRLLDAAAISSDVVGPYLKAWLIRRGRTYFPDGPFPESGYLTPYAFLPYVALGTSLRGAFTLRYALNALIVLIPFAAVSIVPLNGRSFPRLLPAWPMLLLAAAPGLLDTLQTGFQTFDVPFYAALPTLGVIYLFSRSDPRALLVAIPAVPALAMLHPYALVFAPAALVPLAHARRLGDRRSMRWSLALAAWIALPQCYRFAMIARGSWSGLKAHLHSVATSNGAFDSLSGALLYALREEFWVRHPYPMILLPLSPIVALPLGLALQRREAYSRFARTLLLLTLWIAVLGLSLVGLAAWIRYVQPYHLRILYAPLAVEATMVSLGFLLLARDKRRLRPFLGAFLLGILLSTASMVTDRTVSPPSRGTLRGHEAIARIVEAALGPRPVALEYFHLSNELTGYPAAVILDLLLQGTSPSAFLDSESDMPSTRYIIVLTGPRDRIESLPAPRAGRGGNLLGRDPVQGVFVAQLDGVRSLRRWSGRLCERLDPDSPVHVGGANDYLGLLNPDHDIALEGTWFDPCLWDRAHGRGS